DNANARTNPTIAAIIAPITDISIPDSGIKLGIWKTPNPPMTYPTVPNPPNIAPPIADDMIVKINGFFSGRAIPYIPGSVTPNNAEINAGALSVFVLELLVLIQTARIAPASAN